MLFKRIYFVVYIFLFDTLIIYSDVTSENISVQGAIYQLDSFSENKTLIANYAFHKYLDNYQIEINYANSEKFLTGSDGKDTYTLNLMQNARNIDTNTWQFGYIVPGNYPKVDNSLTQFVWLLYNTTSKDDLSQYKINGLGFKWPNDEDVKTTFEFKLEENLPSYTVQWHAPNYILSNKTNKLIVTGYPNGFLASSLKVNSWKLLSNFTFPIVSYLYYFRPKTPPRGYPFPNYSPENVLTNQILVSEATNFAQCQIAKFIPKIDGKASIKDYRFKFMNSEHVSYVVYTNIWPKKDDSFFDINFKEHEETHLVLKKRFIIILCILAFTIIPIFALAKSKINAK